MAGGQRAVMSCIHSLKPVSYTHLDVYKRQITGYAQFEYANAELTDMFALADMAISRAGANSICELLALHKMCIRDRIWSDLESNVISSAWIEISPVFVLKANPFTP